MNRLHEYRHQRSLHIIGVFIGLMGLLSVLFSASLHDILHAMNPAVFSRLNITQVNLDELHVGYQYYLIACIILAGLVADIVGPRTVIVIGIAIAIVANYVFIHANSTPIMLSCRLIIGFTHIFIIMGALTLGTHWLPRRHFSLFVGLFAGALIMAPTLLYSCFKNIVTLEGLQKAFWVINISGFLVILGILLTKNVTDKTRYRHSLKGLFEPLTYYKVWLISVVAMLGWLCNTIAVAFGTLYIIRRFNIDPDNALDIINIATLYFGVGAIFMGVLSDFLDARRYLLAISYCLAALSFSILMFTPSLSYVMASSLLFLTTFLTSSLIICYRKTNEYCTIGNSGIAMSFVFSVSVIGRVLFSPQISSLLQEYSNTDFSINIFSLQWVFMIVPALLLLGAGIAATLIRSRHSKPIVFLPVKRG